MNARQTSSTASLLPNAFSVLLSQGRGHGKPHPVAQRHHGIKRASGSRCPRRRGGQQSPPARGVGVVRFAMREGIIDVVPAFP